jgi:F-type H+-transporting ATPase subunit epsilon
MVLNVTVSAPNQSPWSGLAEKVIITSTTGQVGILSGHAAMVTTVDIGMLLIQTIENEWIPMISFSGIAVVNKDDLQILVNNYETAPTITEQVAEEELKEALENLEIAKNDNTNTLNKVFFSQQAKAASSRLIATQILNKKKVPFN